MKDFNPYLSSDVLQLKRRSTQLYPLAPDPYGYDKRAKKGMVQNDDPKTYWQVKARPGDPTSPFIWGEYALMMVCGGHFDYESTNSLTEPIKPQTVIVKNYNGDVEKRDAPKVKVSNAHSTGKLLGRMMVSGFTWEEATATLERHPEAGGAYWVWYKLWDSFDEARWKEDAHIVRASGEVIPEHDPLDITLHKDVWRGVFSPYRATGSSVGGDNENTHTYSPHGEHSYNLMYQTVKSIISHVKTQTSNDPWAKRSPWVNSDGMRVATSQTLKPMFRGKIDVLLRNGYLPWLVEVGVLIEYRGKISKAAGGKGRTPDVGYRLNPECALGEFYLEFFDVDVDQETHSEATGDDLEASEGKEGAGVTPDDSSAQRAAEDKNRPITLADLEALAKKENEGEEQL